MELTSAELAKYAGQIADTSKVEFSIAGAIKAARERFLAGDVPPRSLMDPATRPNDRKGGDFWDRLNDAKARMIAFDAARRMSPPEPVAIEQMSDAEIDARIAKLRAKTGSAH